MVRRDAPIHLRRHPQILNLGRNQALRAGGRDPLGREFALAAVLLVSACKPDLVGRPSAVDKDVILAIRSSPAEVKPDEPPPRLVTYEALYAGPNGPADPSALDWAFCDQPKPLALTGPISPACLVRRARDVTVTIAPAADGGEPTTQTKHILTPFGAGLVARAAVPVDSCRVFGPFPPEPLPGEPPSRPADPDTTGGYYQPVRLLVPTSGGDAYSVGVTRLDCGIIGATQEQSAEYNKRHTPNANPEISSVALERANGANETLSVAPGSPSELSDGGADAVVTSLDAGGDGSLPDSGAAGATDAGTLPRIAVTPGEQVTFHAKWASCPAPCSNASCPSPTACSGSEAYVDLDLSAHRLVDRRESIRVSWFATDGTFDHDRTGRSEAEATTPNTDNAWTAPSAPADVHMWLVIRDDRGGVGFSTYVIHVGR